jgi:Arc/MetJ-type ribon-helix-helix transcriptional regulator
MSRSTKEKVTVSVDPELLGWADQLVQEGEYESRSAAVEAGLEALHRDKMDAQLEAAFAASSPEEVEEQVALAELGANEWLQSLDAEDGGWGAPEAVHATR